MFKKILLICFISIELISKCTHQHAITASLGGGRFGDKILGYAQARYLSYSTSLPFLYRHFEYSNHLNIEYEALPYDIHHKEYTKEFHINSPQTLSHFFSMIRDPNCSSTLFILDYLPSDIFEWEIDPEWSLLFKTPWEDPHFMHILRNAISSKIPIPNFTREGYLNIAVHVRTLSGTDTVNSYIKLPLKHPPLDYHKKQILRIYEFNLKRPMFVFIFSDTKTPLELLETFKTSFKNYNITFDIQVLNRPDLNNVTQDFFAMQKFDGLIATQSNLSMMASRIGDFGIKIFPVHMKGQYPNSSIDRTQIVSKKTDWFPYCINTIVKD